MYQLVKRRSTILLLLLAIKLIGAGVEVEHDFIFISPVGMWNGEALCKDETAAAFSRNINNAKRVSSVTIFASALGTFELYVNDRLVSRDEDGNRADYLRPGATDVEKRRSYLSYDVTSAWIKDAGLHNTVSAFVARSWFSDAIGRRMAVKPAFAAKIQLVYDDGTSECIETDGAWTGSFETPFLRAGIYFGEVRDGRKAQNASICAGSVSCVTNTDFTGVVSPMEGPGVSLRYDLALSPVDAYVYGKVEGTTEDAFGHIVIDRRWGMNRPVRIEKGEKLVVDFGQNASAIPEIVATAASGVILTFKSAEMLNDRNGEKVRGNDGPGNSIYRANLRTLKDDGALVMYVFAGVGDELYLPTFTFMGYRYAEISATAPVEIKSVRSIPVTSISQSMERGRVRTGNVAVNRLIDNIRWGMYSNYLSIPTDCPQRNERLGWMADTQVFVPAAFRNANVYSFLCKWMTDMRDFQDDKGRFPSIAPRFGKFSGEYGRFGWADAGVVVPWSAWRMTGNTAIIDSTWNAMCRFLANQQKTKNRTELVADGNCQFADWLAYEKYESYSRRGYDANTKMPFPETRIYWDYLAGCYWYGNARRMQEMASAVGKADECSRFTKMADEARVYLKDSFFKDGGRLPVFLRDMQTPHLFALHLGLYDDTAIKEEAVAQLIKNIKDHGGCLQTGFLGTSIIMDTLTYDIHRPDVAYSLLLQRKNPSWLYSVDQGATTIWERWNSYTKEHGFGPVGMNSFNHYAYGAVLDWLYGTAAGIRPGENGGFDRCFILAPIPDPRLGSIHAEYKTGNGVIVSSWRYEGNICRWHFEIPEGSVAAVTFNGGTKEYGPGQHDLARDFSSLCDNVCVQMDTWSTSNAH